MQIFKHMLLGALLSAAAASSMATTIYSQDFSNGLKTNETLTGKWAIADGKLSRGAYDPNEKDFFLVSLDLSGYTDIHLSYDFWIDSESGWDALQLYTRDGQNNHPRLHYASGRSYGGTLNTTLSDKVNLLEFSFTSDWSNQGLGVTIDNILITGTSILPEPMPEPVPEPGAPALMGIGAAGLLLRRGRRAA